LRQRWISSLFLAHIHIMLVLSNSYCQPNNIIMKQQQELLLCGILLRTTYCKLLQVKENNIGISPLHWWIHP
jgi:hypothetical protein